MAPAQTSGSWTLGTARIVAALEEDIIFGRLRPRERLVEDELCTRFHAKRHVVREALAELTRMGIVKRTTNRGASVMDFAPQDVADIYAMRELLQEHAARIMPLPPQPSVLDALRNLQRQHAEAVRSGDLRAILRLNNAFHDTFFEACGNARLAAAIREHAALAHAIRSYRMADPALLSQAVEEHAAMLAALEAADRDRVVTLCVEHIRPSLRAYLDGLPPALPPAEDAA